MRSTKLVNGVIIVVSEVAGAVKIPSNGSSEPESIPPIMANRPSFRLMIPSWLVSNCAALGTTNVNCPLLLVLVIGSPSSGIPLRLASRKTLPSLMKPSTALPLKSLLKLLPEAPTLNSASLNLAKFASHTVDDKTPKPTSTLAPKKASINPLRLNSSKGLSRREIISEPRILPSLVPFSSPSSTRSRLIFPPIPP